MNPRTAGHVFFSMMVLLWAAAEDLRSRRIPDGCILALAILKAAEQAAAVCAGTLQLSGACLALCRAFIHGAAVFTLLLMLRLLTGGGIGMGDIKLFAALGMANGLQTAWRIFAFSLLLCAAISVVLILTGQKNRRETLPLGPFVCAGYLLAVFGTGVF